MAICKLIFPHLGGKSKLLTLLLSVLLFVSIDANSFQFPDPEGIEASDSLIFHKFDGSSYRGSSYNYISGQDENGIMYFGNENGLLEFDGTHWELYKTPQFTPVTFLKIIGDKIYTFGSFGSREFGYFQRDEIGKMIYHSLTEKLPDDKGFRFIANAVEHKGELYFSADSSIINWDGEVLKRIQAHTSLTMYKVEDELIVSLYGSNGGLAKMENDSFRVVNSDFIFEDDYAWEILKKDQDHCLIFTSENGIYEMDINSYETEAWENEINEYFLKDSMYLYYAENYRDSLFITSTWQNGMVIFNDKGEIIKELQKKSGLLSNYATYPTKDRRGNIWLSSGFGLQYMQYFNPEEKLSFQPQAKVRYIKLGDSSVFIQDSSHVLSLKNVNSNSIDFYFSVPSFLKENLQFSFYLKGFDDTWSEWTSNSRKEYTNLPGGEYTFFLRAQQDGISDVDIAPFSFKVIVPIKWYESYITYIFIGLAVGLLIFGFIKYRTHRLSITNKKLERIVKERTSELRSQKEQLKVANEELKTINNELDNFVYRSSHDLVAPLKSLRGLISVAKISTNPDEVESYFKLMNISITKLEEFIRSIMDFSINTKKPLEMKWVSMDHVLDGIVEDLRFYENADKVELIRAFDSGFQIQTDPKRLNIVLSNLVTNALKYHDFKKDEKPFIKVSAQVQKGFYIIDVEDNGSGIPEDYQSKIFEMFFRAHPGIEGSGLGLYIVIDTLNVLKGTISLESKTRQGTTFTVKLPAVD